VRVEICLRFFQLFYGNALNYFGFFSITLKGGGFHQYLRISDR
jgi:hypothetical protein